MPYPKEHLQGLEVCGLYVLLFPFVSTTLQQSPTFVEVVVPLALPKTLTYKWFSESERPQVGGRVVVPLGHKKWTGIVWEVHDRPPEGYVAKEVEAVVDEHPVLTAAQREMFVWMAEHYMCTLGDMVSAALPAGMKLESTTNIVLHPDADPDEERGLDDGAMLLLDALHIRHELSLRECAEILDVKHPQRTLRTLLQRGLVLAKEELKDRQAPKVVSWVRIAEGKTESQLA